MTTPIDAAARIPARIDGFYTPPLVAIDPGLDVVAWAEFRKGLRPPTPAVGLARLTAHGTLETDKRQSLAARLAAIHDGLRDVLTDGGVREVAIEVPSKAGQYARTGKKNQGAMQNLERAIGVIIVAAVEAVGEENVRLVHAPAGRWAKKENRHMWLRAVAKEANVPLPLGPRGGIPHDVWDAIWTGLQVIRTPRMAE